jgi:hypothetical protein
MKPDYEVITKSWNGIEIEIRWARNYIYYDDETTMSHIEVESLSPRRAPLPITETGYKSHFINEFAVDRMGGPEGYVDAWLWEASHSANWQNNKQLSLF